MVRVDRLTVLVRLIERAGERRQEIDVERIRALAEAVADLNRETDVVGGRVRTPMGPFRQEVAAHRQAERPGFWVRPRPEQRLGGDRDAPRVVVEAARAE